MITFIGACFIYLIYVLGTFVGIHQVIDGLQRFRFFNIAWGCWMLWMSEYMTGELGPVIIELYNKL